jgi:hypothetical protein
MRTRTLALGDIIEVSDQKAINWGERRKLRFGSVGRGFDTLGDMWSQHERVFAVQQMLIEHKRTHGGEALGPAARVRADVLNHYPVEVLGVDCCESRFWVKWVEKCETANLPKVIFCFQPSETILKDNDTMGKGFRTIMQGRGYQCKWWHLKAWEYGSALNQTRMLGVFWQGEKKGMGRPRPISLPLRSMANLLLPVGVPRQAWSRDVMTRIPARWSGAC